MCHRIWFLWLIVNATIHSADIMLILDRWSVYSLSRCVHTLDQVELDSQHIPYNLISCKFSTIFMVLSQPRKCYQDLINVLLKMFVYRGIGWVDRNASIYIVIIIAKFFYSINISLSLSHGHMRLLICHLEQ